MKHIVMFLWVGNLMKPSILIADNNTGYLHAIKTALNCAGFKTLTASDSWDALTMAYNTQPDLIVLQDWMPGLSGGELCMQLKADPKMKNIPVMVYGKSPRLFLDLYVSRIGADAVVNKPHSKNNFVTLVSSLLRQPA